MQNAIHAHKLEIMYVNGSLGTSVEEVPREASISITWNYLQGKKLCFKRNCLEKLLPAFSVQGSWNWLTQTKWLLLISFQYARYFPQYNDILQKQII